jgi:hypothetical protein
MRAVVIASLLGLALTSRASAPLRADVGLALYGNHSRPEEFALAAEVLRRTDPAQAAWAAYGRGDKTLIVLCDGYAGCLGPEGVRVGERHPVKVVPTAVGCMGSGAEHARFLVAARQYAARYNQALVALAPAEPGSASDRNAGHDDIHSHR